MKFVEIYFPIFLKFRDFCSLIHSIEMNLNIDSDELDKFWRSSLKLCS